MGGKGKKGEDEERVGKKDNKGTVRNIYESNVNRGENPKPKPISRNAGGNGVIYLMCLRKQLKRTLQYRAP